MTGRGGKLRTNRPKKNLSAYIWRWVRFHSGIDTTQPVTDEFYLYDHVKEVFGYKPTTYRVPEDIRKMIDKIVDEMCDRFKLDKFAGVRRWKGLLF